MPKTGNTQTSTETKPDKVEKKSPTTQTTATTTTTTPPPSEGKVPKTSKAAAAWSNYERNIKMAREAKTKDDGTLDKYVGYCEKNLKEVKLKDASIDITAEEKEVAELRSIADQMNTAANNAVAERDKANEAIVDKMHGYYQIYESEETLSHSSRSSSIPVPVDGKTYFNIASVLDRDNFLKSIEDYQASGKPNNTFVNFIRDLKDYENYVTYSGILEYANKLSGISFEQMKAKNTAKAIESAESAQGYCKGVLAILPNNEKAKNILTFANKAYDNATAGMAKAYTSDFHKTHLNTIVWSTSPLAVGTESQAQVATAFKAGQTIYGTAYFSDKLNNLLASATNTKLFLSFKLDGGTIHYYDPHVTLSEEMKQKSFVQFALVPALTDDFKNDVSKGNKTIMEFNQTMSTKGPMTYKIEVEIEFSKTDEVIAGSFDYDLSGGTEQNEKLFAKIDEMFYESARMPKAAQSNPAIESKVLSKLNAQSNGNQYSNCRITNAVWQYDKNELTSIPIRRFVWVTVLEKKSDGTCLMHSYKAANEYTGNGNYSSELTVFDNDYTQRIKCANGNL